MWRVSKLAERSNNNLLISVTDKPCETACNREESKVCRMRGAVCESQCGKHRTSHLLLVPLLHTLPSLLRVAERIGDRLHSGGRSGFLGRRKLATTSSFPSCLQRHVRREQPAFVVAPRQQSVSTIVRTILRSLDIAELLFHHLPSCRVRSPGFVSSVVSHPLSCIRAAYLHSVFCASAPASLSCAPA